MLNRVSEVMHFLSHAYHSLSDIMVRVRTPPARPLLCRPILIQHSAVVQTGIPIQVEVSNDQRMTRFWVVFSLFRFFSGSNQFVS